VSNQHKTYYPESKLRPGVFICYHYFIGSTGETIAVHNLNHRAGCTRNQEDNLRSVQIVLAGDFTDEMPNPRQIKALKTLLGNIVSLYDIKDIKAHRESSPTQCAGLKFNEWIYKLDISKPVKLPEPEKTFVLSRYYTPLPNQTSYFRKSGLPKDVDEMLANGQMYLDGDTVIYKNAMMGISFYAISKEYAYKHIQREDLFNGYILDFKVNCQGDCLSTASTYKLTSNDAYKVVACPPEYPFRTKFVINDKTFTCWDRGGMIDENLKRVRLDIWSGVGQDGLNRIRSTGVPENPTVSIIHP